MSEKQPERAVMPSEPGNAETNSANCGPSEVTAGVQHPAKNTAPTAPRAPHAPPAPTPTECPHCFGTGWLAARAAPPSAAEAQEPPADQNTQGWADLQASGGLPEAQEAAAKFDIVERLHLILTNHGIASRSVYLGLTTDLVRWAADACRQSQPKVEAHAARPAPPLDWQPTKGEIHMEAVMIPAKTIVQINGVPVALAVDTIVETAYENMALLTGYHYAHLSKVQSAAPPDARRPAPEERL